MNNNKILVVDDDEIIAELLKINLIESGYRVNWASDGEKALDLIENEKFDLIILDIMLPGINGYELCSKLRKKEATILTPILMLSVKDKPPDKIIALKLGADDYITKPFDIDELIARVESLLHRTGKILAANPLTCLPGNVSIFHEVNKRLQNHEEFSFVYIDIDNFKSFNDKYGFEKGDEVIIFTADVVKSCVGEESFLGHVGGDDFVLISGTDYIEPICNEIIEAFDNKVTQYYNPEDRENRFIVSEDRTGNVQMFPIMTLSMGVVTDGRKEYGHYGKIIEQATEMKKYAKSRKHKNKSNFAIDKREMELPAPV
jgi:diguanylate cyclase (GGDEF)-like protein